MKVYLHDCPRCEGTCQDPDEYDAWSCGECNGTGGTVVEVDFEAATNEAMLDIARLTWGTAGQAALETIYIAFDGIIRKAVNAALGIVEAPLSETGE